MTIKCFLNGDIVDNGQTVKLYVWEGDVGSNIYITKAKYVKWDDEAETYIDTDALDDNTEILFETMNYHLYANIHSAVVWEEYNEGGA